MFCVVSRIRFKVETLLTRSHTSINSWLNPRQRSPRWRGTHHERQQAHQLIRHPSTLIADYGKKKCLTSIRWMQKWWFLWNTSASSVHFNYAVVNSIINCTWWINSFQSVVMFYFRVTRTVFQDRWLPVEKRNMALLITALGLHCNIL